MVVLVMLVLVLVLVVMRDGQQDSISKYYNVRRISGDVDMIDLNVTGIGRPRIDLGTPFDINSRLTAT